jgi:hypothetical protein
LRAEGELRAKTVSLISAAGKLIILEDDGSLHIAEATPSSFKEISSCNVLESEQTFRRFWTHPGFCNGRLHCKDVAGNLVCIDVSKSKSSINRPVHSSARRDSCACSYKVVCPSTTLICYTLKSRELPLSFGLIRNSDVLSLQYTSMEE